MDTQPSIQEPSLTDLYRLLLQLSTDVAALKTNHQTELAASYESQIQHQNAQMAQNHSQLLQQLEKLSNPTKKHTPDSLAFPLIWRLRGLSRGFRDLISSNEFAKLNLIELIDDDVTYMYAPTPYQSLYAQIQLSHLRSVNWSDTFGIPLHIPISWLPALRNLVELIIFGSGLISVIPHEIGLLTSLERLLLPNNSLSGPIPPSIGNLKLLRELDLSHNQLTGTIPDELRSLENIRILSLHNNDDLFGHLHAFSTLKLIEKLCVFAASTIGPIPADFGGLVNLKYLALGLFENPAVDTIIPPELGQLTQLVDLDLSCSSLVGSIPRELGALVNLERLDLHNNWLVGEVPIELLRLPRLRSCHLEEK
ncbi:L domain-like protein [Rhizoclosmatium globosum]|uniref:L domain-like protein n=1 Tax=Rhizoclosmatium globosum TaxID=329046 RepID=A0A1Y2CLE4_9FUNG|nr:L domain-like protein [Rhizoclosmatium globosum]|eukprot:ORY47839.1 L domain-like protein [Rhizoclosmatium globosum]